MIILGIDPGLAHTGWGIIKKNGNSISFVASGRISTNKSTDTSERLLLIYNEINKVINTYKPDCSALEETFVNENAQSSLTLGYARAVLILALALNKINITHYAPNMIKKAVVGVGRADKSQVQAMVKILLPGAKIDNYDTADALATAICHSSYVKYKELLGINK